ncbi:MAG: tetratricopeptide repeat protein [Candidatus Kapaibacteriota bacterium]|jgi:tetratricopeptide (TPR) repeat protein
MEFWSFDDNDEFYEGDEDDNPERPVENLVRVLDVWFELKKSSGSDFTYDDLEQIEEVLDVCIDNGFYKSALKFCNALLEYYPTSIELLTKKGYILMNLKEFAAAIESLEQAIAINPSDPEALMNLSLSYYNTGDYQKSLNLIDKVLAIEPSEFAMFQKGLILQSYQRYDEALEVFKLLINSKEYNEDALQEISHILFLQGKFEESLGMNLDAIQREPFNHWYWFNLGLCYLELGRYYRAIDAFQNAISINPYFSYSYLYLGWAYSSLGRYKQAIHSLIKYAGKRFDKYVYFEIANLLADVGFYIDAVKIYKKIVEKDYTFAPAHIGMALCYKQLGEIFKAEDCFKNGTSLDPKNVDFWQMAISFLLENKKISKAFSWLATALNNNPNNENLLADFRFYVFKYKRFNEGIEILEDIKALSPNNANLLFYLGEFYARIGELQKSIDYFTESIHLNQKLYQSLKTVMQSILKKKDYSTFEKLLNLKLSTQQLNLKK